MTQQEFYNSKEVQEQIEIQKRSPYGSEAHKAAHLEIGKIAEKMGVGEERRKSGGDIY